MCKILILEDEASVMDIIENFAAESGFTYKSATNVVEALLILDKYKSIRICLVDLHLPGIDGLSFCRKIKAIDPLMIVIAMTGFRTLFSLVECRQAGFDDMLFKPFDFALLKSTLEEYDARITRWSNHKNV